MQRWSTDRTELDATVALQLAMERGTQVAVLIRSSSSLPGRVVIGVPVDFRMARDGRERVVLRIQQDTYQFLLLERIARVSPSYRDG